MAYPSFWFPMFAVFIYPSPVDVNHADGLCGTFNGDPTDDFMYGDGTTVATDPYLYYTNEDISGWDLFWLAQTDFHQSWE